ncbi:uroporphyrinogen-III synthase [Microvirga massiliensis]|uniref:uroporphyrinogen-III synthase n=1 Tax=Microvirga massiliensis TaxID=1033741 RepID=UPI00062BE0A1|nr:uroporphyrinogen-III synthase [Microvirga massiliensis]
MSPAELEMGHMAGMRVLLTRPLQQSRMLAADLARLGWEPMITPMLEIAPRTWHDGALSGAQAVLLTSANGARELARAVSVDRNLPAYCVGPATAEPLAQAGFVSLHCASGTATDLVRLVHRDLAPRNGPLAYLSGNVVSRDLGPLLAPFGFEVRRAIVYESRPARTLTDEARHAIAAGEVAVVLFLSVRTALTFRDIAMVGELAQACEAIRAVTLSQQIASALEPLKFAQVAVAREPNRSALLAALGG